jgi:glycosyltransferase involved in cell wall biosynthesis
MKIGIDIRVLAGRRTGIGRLVKEMITALSRTDKENLYTLFFNTMKGQIPSDLPVQENFKLVSVQLPNRLLNLSWAYTPYPKVERFTGPLDVFHGSSFQMPPTRGAASVLSIHDLVFLIYPEMAIPSSVRHFGPRIREYARRADIITTISNATATDIIKYLDVSPEKVRNVYPGATLLKKATAEEIIRVRSKHRISGNYILFVGCIEPRKNLARLLEAFDLSNLSTDFELVLTGPKGWHTKEIFEKWQKLKNPERVRWIDYVGDNDLAPLYSGASFLAFPSILEGFGLPILEAMSVGCPVLTSNISAMPEVAGDAAVYVDPFDIDSIAQGMIKLADDLQLRKKMSELGYLRTGKFTWENTAIGMIKVYQWAADLRARRS